MDTTERLTTLYDGLFDWLTHGLWGFSGWQIVIYTLVTTHITIAAVTIFLHRSQAHRSVKLQPVVSHFFRCWLWLTTGIVTREWVAVHRKHHAACETPEDPHSPQTRGISEVLLRGSELYAAAAKAPHLLDQYGAGTPNDWIERKLYTPHSLCGVGLMLIIDLLAFGAIGVTVWAVQMLWIPISAAGIVNGIGHWWGYRNFELADASRNIVPWGILIGGEELHNNHHTYPTSAKLSVRRYEFDLGWAYIRALEMLGLATVRRGQPQLRLGSERPVADANMLNAIIANRYELMAHYARRIHRAALIEWVRLRAQGHSVELANLRHARRWLHRDVRHMPSAQQRQVSSAIQQSQVLTELITMRELLRPLWTPSGETGEQLVAHLQAWLKKAEASGSDTLQEFSAMLRAVRT
ncbi:stearoyl-CoA desaturase (delta-9 desaturase) [Pseudomonas antarctica]|uniref:Fatty acid desaturase n=1 Tax=Pseudomonas antarctica TaxID=219572 RepID=A0A1H0BV25_9PSED|nr:fatty acid desaturase [Pseudomonas antarctica]KAF2406661.1 fatty acid desaturase [Pseudomonas antarctica]SDN49479.1 stearoyl-CoA desaturase (delta-9 desaturase) [Pseudomonas antarctica]